jgi:antitoxin HicB
VKYPIIVYPCVEGGFVAEVPALIGCLAQGETLLETLEELEIVSSLWIEMAHRKGVVFPNAEDALLKMKELIRA